MKSRGEALRDYVLRRLLLMIPTFVGITFITFLLIQFVPGGQIDQMRMALAGAGEGGEGVGFAGDARLQLDIPDEQLAKLREFYGFDRPFLTAYGSWLWDTVRLNLGLSFRYNEPVVRVILDRLPVSIYYGVMTAFFTYAICIPLGIVKAIRHRSRLDNATSIVIFVGYAIPGFALGAVLSNLLSVYWPIFPLGGFQSPGAEQLAPLQRMLDIAYHSVLPLIAYLVGSFAVTTMLMKNSLMENMSADYVKTALAKGLHWRRAVFVHALRNSLIPMATSIGSLLGIFLTGSFLIERVFNIPGVGLLAFEAIQARDFPLVLGFLVISSVLLMLGNLVSDLAVAFVDPRVRFE
ncbi:MAG TPA: ABC transporter permease subunit [Burkholderiaceae bacterium]|nr:ABC transporter permease subunit [Burkholderiaceae bacterium]